FHRAAPFSASDGGAQPAYTMSDFTPSSVPGCRAPHVWLRDGRSLYDALGPDYTLLRFDPAVRVAGLVEAAARRRVPLAVVDVAASDARPLYARNLVLVRPDQHVAWRGNCERAEPLGLVDLVRGAASAQARWREVAARDDPRDAGGCPLASAGAGATRRSPTPQGSA